MGKQITFTIYKPSLTPLALFKRDDTRQHILTRGRLVRRWTKKMVENRLGNDTLVPRVSHLPPPTRDPGNEVGVTSKILH